MDDGTPSMGHSTFAHILIDIDISSPLRRDVVLMVGDRPLTQPLDYEGLPFHCQKCFSMGHLASDCSLPRDKGVATWWKDATADHLTVNALDSDYVGSSHEDDVSSRDGVVPLTIAEASIDPLTSIIVASFVPEVPTIVTPILQCRYTPAKPTLDVILSQ